MPGKKKVEEIQVGETIRFATNGTYGKIAEDEWKVISGSIHEPEKILRTLQLANAECFQTIQEVLNHEVELIEQA